MACIGGFRIQHALHAVGNEWKQAGYTDLIGSHSPLVLELVGRLTSDRIIPSQKMGRQGNAAPVCRLPCVSSISMGARGFIIYI
jgi:hypothetical protein